MAARKDRPARQRRQRGTGALFYSETRGLWFARVELEPAPDGLRRYKRIARRSKRDALTELGRMREEVKQFGEPLDRATTVEDAASAWLADAVRRVDPKTYDGYKSAVACWITPTIGPKKLATLRPSDVRSIHAAVAAAGRSIRTAQIAHTAITQILDWALQERLVAQNVAALVKRPRAKDVSVAEERPALPSSTVVSIFQAATGIGDARHWWRLLTGARQGEILGARLQDVDLVAGVWTVNWQLQELKRRHGCEALADGSPACGQRFARLCPDAGWRVPDGYAFEQIEGRWHWVWPKSKRGKEVPLIPALVEVARRWLAHIENRPNPYGLLFPDEAGHPVLPKRDQQDWRDLLARAGVIEPGQAIPGGTELTGHIARHTVVTALVEAGVPYEMVGQIVGHDPEIARTVYTHLGLEKKQEAMGGLADAWGDALTLPAA